MKIFRNLSAIAVAAVAVTLLTAANKPVKKECAIMKYENKDFYKADGTFDAAKAKQAYYDMMKRFHYPVYEKLKGDDFWAVDFSLKDFVRVGMAGIFWCNDKKEGYFGHEIYLLPGQMIVEHGHVAAGDVKSKMETWQVRHGSIYTFGEGEATTPCPVKLPESQAKYITGKNCKLLKEGDIAALNRAEAKHFMIAGPEGAIVTEYATPHDNEGLRFTNPGVKF